MVVCACRAVSPNSAPEFRSSPAFVEIYPHGVGGKAGIHSGDRVTQTCSTRAEETAPDDWREPRGGPAEGFQTPLDHRNHAN